MLKLLLHLSEIAISAYALYHASIAIPNLQKWQSKSETAAKYSNTAADELHRTQATETAGTVVSLASILCSFFLTVGFIAPGFTTLLSTLLLAITTAGASVFVGDFWDQKGKVPFVSSYSDAVKSTKQMRGHLALLGILWSISFFLELFV